MLIFAASGTAIAARRIAGENPVPKSILAGGALCLFLLIIANGAWVSSYVGNSLRYRSDPNQYFESMVGRPDAPELLMFPMSRIGEWISRNTEPSAVVATRWKQLSFWIEGRKLLELNPMLPVDQFENQMRDYRVGYLVALLDRSRLREFETQMALSSRFSFTPVHRVGNAVIIRIADVHEDGEMRGPLMPVPVGESLLDSLNSADEQLQYLFRLGLQSMDKGWAEEAEAMFQSLSTRAGRSGTVVLYTAIARSFAGKFKEAEELLRNVREGQQAGPLLVHSWYHLQIIEKLRQADAAPDPSARADILTRVAADYWSLGFRLQAERILQRAIESDPTFAPTLVFGIYFDLQRRDTVSAKARLRQLRSFALSHPSVTPLSQLLAGAEAAAKEDDISISLTHREAVAQSYQQIGLIESVIDELTDIISQDPFRLPALRRLAKIYVERERYAPAKRILNRISEIAPEDSVLKELREKLENRWGND
jgi:tetratricopeptide (TPR) repeat protein